MRRLVAVVGVVACLGCGRTAAPRPEVPPVAPAAQPETRETRRETFARAYRLIRQERFQEARPLLETLIRGYPELEDYTLHYLALASAREGAFEQAMRLWTRLISTQPRSLFVADASLERARLWRAEGNLDAARADLEVARGSDRTEVAHAAMLEMAQLDTAAGNATAAYEDLMALRRSAAGTAIGREAKRRVEDLRRRDPALAPRGAALEAELPLLLAEQDYDAAIAAADQLLSAAPETDRPTLLRRRADAELGAGKFNEAIATLDEIVRRHPASRGAPDALFRAASLLWNRDRNLEARARFAALRRRYPRDPHAAEALYAIARIADAEGNTTEALSTYARLADAYPQTTLAREGRWRIGWIHYQARRWREAIAAFDRMARRTRDEEAVDALYWRARAQEHAGDRTAASQAYRRILNAAPTSYYAYWAECHLDMPSPGSPPIVAPPPRALTDPPAVANDRYHFARAYELHAAGLSALALQELRAFEHANLRTSELTPYLVSAYTAVDGYRDAMRLERGSGDASPEVLYPLAFWPTLTRLTAGTTVDPLLVLGLMRQESLFDSTARSRADARGLMQLLPRTAEAEARRTGRPFTAGDLYDPETNLTLGIAHLQHLLDRYQGNRFKALAAYNGGEEAVAKWEARFGGLELDEFVESISYRETRDYVKKVTSHYRHYRRLYAPASA